MYRQEFPHAPNLWGGVAPRRRSLAGAVSDEFRRTWLTATIGIGMVIAGAAMLFINEGRAVQTARSLDEGHSNVIVPETTEVVFEENQGKLVLVADALRVPDPLKDDAYGIAIHAVKLKKVVQMYQWYEEEDRREAAAGAHEGDHDGHDTRSYSYATGWFDHLINSDQFDSPMGHHNPDEWPVNASVLVNNRVKLGDFILGSDLKEKFDDYTIFTSDERPSTSGIKMHAGLYFHAEDVWKPEVGDIRVQFSYAGREKDLVTVVGKQTGREIRPYRTEAGDDLLILQAGLRMPKEVFHLEHAQNRTQTWIYRLAGWFLSFLGCNCIASILDIIVEQVAVLRNALLFGQASVAFSFSVTICLLTIGLGWIIYRPLLGLTSALVSLLPFSAAILRRIIIRKSPNGHRKRER